MSLLLSQLHLKSAMAHQHYQSWLWDSFKLYNSLYSCTTLNLFVIDLETHKFHVEKSSLRLLFWCLSIILNVIFITFCASIYNIGKWFINPHYITVNQMIASLATFIICLLVLYICYVSFKHRHEYVLGLNTLWNLHLVESQRQIEYFGKSKDIILYHKIVGLFLKGIV